MQKKRMKIFTHLLLSFCFMLAANFAIAQCGSIVNVQVETCNPLPEANFQTPVYCNNYVIPPEMPGNWDCEGSGGVTHYFITNPGNIVTSGGTVGAEIVGTSTSPNIVPEDYGFEAGACLEVVEVCYDLAAMQNLVVIFDTQPGCCSIIDLQFSGACSGILALFDQNNLPQDLGDVVTVVNAFNLDDMGNPLPISIDFFASIADAIMAQADLLGLVCDGAVPINYCTDTIPNAATNVYTLIPCVPLGIEMNSLEGNNTAMGNELKWTTETETDNEYFLIERSLDGYSFEEIGIVEGAGNSTSAIDYKYMDDKVSGSTNYYRITAVSYTEQKNHSNVIAIETTRTSTLDGVDIVPNPVKETMTLSFDSEEIGEAQIFIVDGTGKNVMDFTINTVVGYNEIQQELSELTNGLYMAIIRIGDQTASEKFLKL